MTRIRMPRARTAPEPTRAPAWNLFRRAPDLDLCCAVPEDRAVPGFLDGGWRFQGRLDEDRAPDGFDGAAARLGASLLGFHLFMACRRRDPGAAAAR